MIWKIRLGGTWHIRWTDIWSYFEVNPTIWQNLQKRIILRVSCSAPVAKCQTIQQRLKCIGACLNIKHLIVSTDALWWNLSVRCHANRQQEVDVIVSNLKCVTSAKLRKTHGDSTVYVIGLGHHLICRGRGRDTFEINNLRQEDGKIDNCSCQLLK